MTLPRNWLRKFLGEAFAQHRPAKSLPLRRSPSSARRAVLAMSYARGLAFGAPILRRDQVLSRDAGEFVLLLRWLVVLADHIHLIGEHLDPPDLPLREKMDVRVRAMASALACVFGTDEDVLVLSTFQAPAKVDRALSNLERELMKRRYLQGNPLLGLTLYPAFSALDARALLLAAVDNYGKTPSSSAQRQQAALAQERIALVAAIAALSQWREVDAEVVDAAVVWQIKALGLTREETGRFLEFGKKPPDIARLITLVPPGASPRVVLAVTVAARVDGRLSPEERVYIRHLGDALLVQRSVRKRIDRRVVQLMQTYPDAYNPLALADGFAALGPPLGVRLARVIYGNLDALWNEIRETGDLGMLLAKRASGKALSDAEQRRMREQLLDVVRTVPSLAMFALPGGSVLLPVLLRLLPFDLRPSSFRRREEGFHAFSRGADDVAAEGGTAEHELPSLPSESPE